MGQLARWLSARGRLDLCTETRGRIVGLVDRSDRLQDAVMDLNLLFPRILHFCLALFDGWTHWTSCAQSHQGNSTRSAPPAQDSRVPIRAQVKVPTIRWLLPAAVRYLDHGEQVW